MSHPEPEKVFDAPLYFRREWPGFTIYGYSCESSYPEDEHVAQRAWRDYQRFLSICFSVAEPRGEIGFTPLHATEEITRDEFELARKLNWAL